MTIDDETLSSESQAVMKNYAVACQKEFWQEVLKVETAYLIQHLEDMREILSVGCGPAIIEGELAQRGFRITGLDVSREALNSAPDRVRTIAARMEDVSLPESSFDAVIYVASLQFIEDYRKALEKTFTVLRPGGRLILMLLNPDSAFIKKKLRDPDSYVCKIRHTDLQEIEKAVAARFVVKTEYFMGVRAEELFVSQDPDWAVLYIITGTKPDGLEGDQEQ